MVAKATQGHYRQITSYYDTDVTALQDTPGLRRTATVCAVSGGFIGLTLRFDIAPAPHPCSSALAFSITLVEGGGGQCAAGCAKMMISREDHQVGIERIWK